MKNLIIIFLFLILSTVGAAKAGELIVAVASSSLCPMQAVANLYGDRTGSKVVLIAGSTGKLYSQITEGAPFDIFLSADSHHPELLTSGGFAKGSNLFSFARGSLALWTRPGVNLEETNLPLISMANPKTAPYGRAAKEALDKLYFKNPLKIIYGESVAQAFLFAKSGNVDAALISEQTLRCKKEPFQVIDKKSYSPIEQSGVIIKESPLSLSFRDFLLSSEGRGLLKSYGYVTYANGDI